MDMFATAAVHNVLNIVRTQKKTLRRTVESQSSPYLRVIFHMPLFCTCPSKHHNQTFTLHLATSLQNRYWWSHSISQPLHTNFRFGNQFVFSGSKTGEDLEDREKREIFSKNYHIYKHIASLCLSASLSSSSSSPCRIRTGEKEKHRDVKRTTIKDGFNNRENK